MEEQFLLDLTGIYPMTWTMKTYARALPATLLSYNEIEIRNLSIHSKQVTPQFRQS